MSSGLCNLTGIYQCLCLLKSIQCLSSSLLLQELRALEGQSVTLRCKARGDPDPIIHWIAPDGRLMSNSSRSVVHTDGTLDILISTVKDSGLLTPLPTALADRN